MGNPLTGGYAIANASYPINILRIRVVPTQRGIKVLAPSLYRDMAIIMIFLTAMRDMKISGGCDALAYVAGMG